MARQLLRSHAVRMLSVCLAVWIQAAPSAWGHPGAIKDGRASCGREFDSASAAFTIPDVKEAWFLRRIATCESPFFWTKFPVTQVKQKVFVAVMSTQIKRFEDQLDFNAILFGPGLPAISADALPEGVTVPKSLGGRVLRSPSNLSECGFVQENAVMRNFASVIGGRCMEKFEMKLSDYKDKDPLQAGATYYSWWLYSKDMEMELTGDYYLVSWLTQRGKSIVTTGKYEITIGPWTWYGYAPDAMKKQAQSQLTTCTCASNGIAYLEQELGRLGFADDEQDAFASALPNEKCGSGTKYGKHCVQEATCRSAHRSAKLSNSSAVEFAGVWKLQPGKSYLWTFRALHPDYTYPDASMDIYVTPCDSIDSVSAHSDAAMSGKPTAIIEHHGNIKLVLANKQTLTFRDNPTTVFNISVPQNLNTSASVRFCFFTQHRPEEFLAMHFACTSCANEAKYAFPTDTVLYGVQANALDSALNASSHVCTTTTTTVITTSTTRTTKTTTTTTITTTTMTTSTTTSAVDNATESEPKPAKSVVLSGSMNMEVPDGFKTDAVAQAAVKAGIAEGAGVPASYVALSISDASRRLEAARQLASAVKIEYTITIPASSTVTASTVTNNLNSKSTVALTALVQSKVTTAKGANYTVTVKTKIAPTEQDAIHPMSNATSSAVAVAFDRLVFAGIACLGASIAA